MASDNFNRSNGAIGSNWTTTTGLGLEVFSNQARVVSNTPGSARYTGVSFSGNHYSQASISTGLGDLYVAVRMQANGNHYSFYNDRTTGRLELYYVYDSGASYELLADLGTAANQSQSAVFKLEANGTTLKAYVNGAQAGSDVTHSALSGGAPGIGADQNASLFDDWSGDDLVAATPVRISQIATELISGAVLTDIRVSQVTTELISLPGPINLLTELKSHWPFDESSGSAIDQHGANDLTLTGPASGQDPIDSTPAREVEDFNDTKFSCTADTDLQLSNDQSFTFVIRFKLETAPNLFFILNKSDSSSVDIDYQLFWQTGTGFGFAIYDTSTAFTTVIDPGPGNDYTSLSDNLGQTFVIACGYDPTTDKLWIRINNASRVEVTTAAGTRNLGSTFVVGAAASSSTAATFDGSIGPLSFWKRSLTNAEIDYWIDIKGNYSDFDDSSIIPDLRISQVATELISLVTPDSRVSQLTIELLSPVTALRTSQIATELISLVVADPRISQLAVELISFIPPTESRVSQLTVELIQLVTSDPRVSQLAIETMSENIALPTEKTEFFIIAG